MLTKSLLKANKVKNNNLGFIKKGLFNVVFQQINKIKCSINFFQELVLKHAHDKMLKVVSDYFSNFQKFKDSKIIFFFVLIKL